MSPFDGVHRHLGVGDLFRIGIGPSSSHTVGPMRAAAAFVAGLEAGQVAAAGRLRVTLFGSLAWTGRGHGTVRAVIGGLEGRDPETVDPRDLEGIEARVARTGRLTLPSGTELRFDPAGDVVLDRERATPRHPNALSFVLRDRDEALLASETWYSVGGGFVERDGDEGGRTAPDAVKFPFRTADELLGIGAREGLTIPEIMRANEVCQRGAEGAAAALDAILDAMHACIDRGLGGEGELPGGLRVKRRAKALVEELQRRRLRNLSAPTDAIDHAAAFAIAVNEQNAAGGRVVTAPTNGAAGVVPAVLRYYDRFCDGATRQGGHDLLLAAAAIGGIIKRNASISGAEVGCQGEVGSAAAMAAAGLTAALGGSNPQVENAAEIALEHHLGMTCDPVGGLVQIPCIERNAFGAVKAITAASLALSGDGTHRVSLDQVIETMRQTGRDMSDKYRETSRGGLAVNVPEC